jgi:NAD-dependent dihydropyrimidine dehydrogenase PreA subunit
VTYVISEPCIDVKDKSCIEECPVDCIYEGDRMLYIHPDECVDCGACEPVCPVEAIFYDDDVPAQWKEFTAANAAFFTEGDEPLGSRAGRPTSALCYATPSSLPTIRSQRPKAELVSPRLAAFVICAEIPWSAWWLAPHTVMTTLARACSTSRYRMASGASLSG